MAKELNLGTPLESASSGARKLSPNQGFWERRNQLIETHSEWKSRVKEITSIVNGEWHMLWANLTATAEAPSVANIIEMGIHHWSAIGGAVIPQVRIPVPVNKDLKGGERAARKRERRVHELWDSSNINELMAQWWGDYAGAGAAYCGIWGDFSVDSKDRDPYLQRLDPRYCYPLKDTKGNIIELLVAKRVSTDVILKQYPVAKGVLDPKVSEVEEWFWFFPDRYVHMVADASRKGMQKRTGIILTDEPNLLGKVPVVEVGVPSFDGQPRGIFDQTRHILRTMHRLMTLTITSSEEEVYPPIFEYDVMNPDDFGPGAVLHGRSPEARLDRMQSRSHFDAKDLIGRLASEARSQASFPGQLSGDPGASIVSARGIEASMGQIDARLALAHKQFESFLEKATEILLAFDEKYCDGEKTIHGDAADKKKPEIFIPSRDIAGHYENNVRYGIGAGTDPSNREMRLAMNLNQNLISRETARDEMDFLEDPAREEVRIVRQRVTDSLMEGIYQQAAQGNVQLAAELLSSMGKEDKDLNEVVNELLENLQQPAPEEGLPPGGGMPPGGLPPGLGGLPPEGGPPPEGAGLPSLGSLGIGG